MTKLEDETKLTTMIRFTKKNLLNKATTSSFKNKMLETIDGPPINYLFITLFPL
jgi:hypothetical protein